MGPNLNLKAAVTLNAAKEKLNVLTFHPISHVLQRFQFPQM